MCLQKRKRRLRVKKPLLLFTLLTRMVLADGTDTVKGHTNVQTNTHSRKSNTHEQVHRNELATLAELASVRSEATAS